MILKQPKIQPKPVFKHVPIIKPYVFPKLIASCGHGEIKPNEEAYIHSKTTDGNYCDMVCMCNELGIEYSTEQREFLKDYYEVVSHG